MPSHCDHLNEGWCLSCATGKEPVQNPCEAETFDEAARKNRARLENERLLAKNLYDEMTKDGDKGAEDVNPDFWQGAAGANDQAFRIYQEELEEALRRVADRVARLQGHEGNTKRFLSGYSSIRDNWEKALRKNDPSIIVYW